MRTVATFRSSAFNSSETKGYFLNRGCFGDDVAKWMMQRLRERGIPTDDEPGQEDFGWFFDFEVPEGRHCCVVGFRPGDRNEEGDWIASLERSRGLVGSLLGGRDRGIAASAVNVIHAILVGSPEIQEINWHTKKDFDASREDQGGPIPEQLS
jgi:hypothetical protein